MMMQHKMFQTSEFFKSAILLENPDHIFITMRMKEIEEILFHQKSLMLKMKAIKDIEDKMEAIRYHVNKRN